MEVLVLDGSEALPHDLLRHACAGPQLAGLTGQRNQSSLEPVGDNLDGIGGQVLQGLCTGLGATPEETRPQTATGLQRSHGGQRPAGGRQSQPTGGWSSLPPGARIDLRLHPRHWRGQKGLGGVLEPSRGIILSIDVVRQAGEVGAQARPCAVPGAAHQAGSTMTSRQQTQPVAQRRDGSLGQQTLMGTRVRDDEEGGLGQPQSLEAGHQVAAHFRKNPGGDPIEHNADGCASPRGILKRRPGSVVAIARGSGDEEPQVSGLQKTQRQSPVGLVHGVEIRGINKGQARRNGLREDATAHLRQRMVGERIGVLRIHNQHGRARRGSQDPGLGDLGAQDGVDQRGLARTGGAAHDDDGGQIGIDKSRQHMVSNLSDQAGSHPAGVGDAIGVQRELKPFQVPHGIGQDIDELGATERRDRNILPGGE